MATELDLKHIREAIALAKACNPIDPDRIPKVGAIFAIGETVIGKGQRGSGKPGDDEHAEFNALGGIVDKTQLSKATVYSTLEPCTRDVRSRAHEACTELIRQHEVHKVFIGILDPNQGVCGKGVLELQKHKIEVELFPPAFAQEIRLLMAPFIAAQQTLGAKIVQPTNDANVELVQQADGGWFAKLAVVCECINAPGSTVRVIVEHEGSWYPQTTMFREIGEKQWQADVTFGTKGRHVIHVVRANATGTILADYYRDVVARNEERTKELRRRLISNSVDPAILARLPSNYQGIRMPSLPKGLDPEDHVAVTLVSAPKK